MSFQKEVLKDIKNRRIVLENSFELAKGLSFLLKSRVYAQLIEEEIRYLKKFEGRK